MNTINSATRRDFRLAPSRLQLRGCFRPNVLIGLRSVDKAAKNTNTSAAFVSPGPCCRVLGIRIGNRRSRSCSTVLRSAFSRLPDAGDFDDKDDLCQKEGSCNHNSCNWVERLKKIAKQVLPLLSGAALLLALYTLQSPAQALADTFQAQTTSRANLQLASNMTASASFTYSFQKVMTASIVVKLIAALSIAFPICVVGGLAYSVIGGVPLGKSIRIAYDVASDSPGADIVSEENPSMRFVLHLIFIVGLLTYAVFIAIVSDELSSKIQDAKDTNGPVMESGHNVILGWNRVGRSLLQQAAESRKELSNSTWGKPIVVLHEDATPEFRDELLEELKGKNLNIITRQGNPNFMPDLLVAGAPRAKTVVLLADDDDANKHEEEADNEQFLKGLSTAVSLNVLMKDQKQAHKDQLWLLPDRPAASMANQWMIKVRNDEYAETKGKIVTSAVGRRTHWMAGQCLLQPGLARVYANLMCQSVESAEFYIMPEMDELVGKPHGVIRQLFPINIVCGYVHKDISSMKSAAAGSAPKLIMNPDDNYIMQPGDKAIFVSMDGPAKTSLPKNWTRSLPPLIESPAPAETVIRGKRIVLVQPTWDDRFDTIMRSIAEFSGPGTSVTVLDHEKPKNMEEYESDSLTVRFVEGTITDKEALLEAGIDTCDSILLCAHDDNEADSKSHDAQTMAAVSLLVNLREQGPEGQMGRDGKSMHIVTIVNFDETVAAMEILTHYSHANITIGSLIPDQIVAGIITQVAAQPDLHLVIRELLSKSEGCELYVRKARGYIKDLEQRTSTFGELETLARQRGETMIGYIPAGYIRGVHTGTVRLAGSRSQVVDLENDSLVVIDH